MENSTGYQSPISTARPRGARVIEVYSPKLGRRLQCFGEDWEKELRRYYTNAIESCAVFLNRAGRFDNQH
jgi:hypothetical protein